MDNLFDSNGNVITKKPKTNKLQQLNQEFEELVNNKTVIIYDCQYCESKWKSNASLHQHENWCKKNPNKRTYRKKDIKKPKKKSKKEIIITDNNIIKDLKVFDKLFGLTDDQIVKYIRTKLEGK